MGEVTKNAPQQAIKNLGAAFNFMKNEKEFTVWPVQSDRWVLQASPPTAIGKLGCIHGGGYPLQYMFANYPHMTLEYFTIFDCIVSGHKLTSSARIGVGGERYLAFGWQRANLLACQLHNNSCRRGRLNLSKNDKYPKSSRYLALPSLGAEYCRLAIFCLT